ncbi:MAG: gliding motility-associated C-terminal domain-containing protein [Cytophagales bacterium]|nr:gliding motility-associated C-terminal domain-containing protein [Cytophagales bacterium]
MRSKYIVLWFLLIFGTHNYASHIRAGEILANKIGQFQYRFTFILYRDRSGVTQEEVTFKFGDGQEATSTLKSQSNIGNNTDKYQYEATHTYAGPGEYTISVEVFARNAGILNVPNSSQTAFYVESKISIDPFVGTNTSPQLLAPPIDLGYKDKVFTHNPAAWDAEGDSLAFELITPLIGENTTVPGYTLITSFGGRSNTGGGVIFTFDNKTGQMVWNTPPRTGLFNVAFKVTEFRDGVQIGFVMRDMQIIINENDADPPQIIVPGDTCITAGNILQDTITGLDPSGLPINIYSYNGAFALPASAASLSCHECTGGGKVPGDANQYKYSFDVSPAKVIYSWTTSCQNIRGQPYNIVFKAENNLNSPDKLVDIKPWLVKVSAPPILNFKATPSHRSMILTWKKYTCNNAAEIQIYRRKCRPDTVLSDSCVTGVEYSTSFELIGKVKGQDTTFTDNNAGKGLSRASLYCYMIYATFPLPAEGVGRPSKSVCAVLSAEVPVILKASVLETSSVSGTNLIQWTKPAIMEKVTSKYEVYRIYNNTSTKIFETDNMNITTCTDNNLNTQDIKYDYYITYNNTFVENTDTASTPLLSYSAKPGEVRLSWKYDTPWDNTTLYHYIFRKNKDSTNYRLIDSVLATGISGSYADVGKYKSTPLKSNEYYNYFITTQGRYQCENKDTTFLKLPERLLNNSNTVSVLIPDKDTLKPCAPVLYMTNINCDSLDLNKGSIYWTPSQDFLCDETNYYVIYNAPTPNDTFIEISSSSKNITYYQATSEPLQGCYYVIARDALNTNSKPSNTVCVPKNDCLKYELPNVFTPNNDNVNDKFTPLAGARAVTNVLIEIYNRWGVKIFTSNSNINIDWDGSGQPDGIYYYHAVLLYESAEGTKNKLLNGWVQIIR